MRSTLIRTPKSFQRGRPFECAQDVPPPCPVSPHRPLQLSTSPANVASDVTPVVLCLTIVPLRSKRVPSEANGSVRVPSVSTMELEDRME